MQIAILTYPGMTALDVVGPYEVLRGLPGAQFRFVWREPGPIITDSGELALAATHSFDETPAPDIVLVGGSIPATMATASDHAVMRWLRTVHPGTSWTASVCSGSLILGAAGLLNCRNATCHWAGQRMLARFGAHPQPGTRFVRDGKVLTAAGVSAGIDLALWLVAEVAGRSRAEAVQLGIEYDPQPPFDAGHPSKASTRTKAAALSLMNDLTTTRELATELRLGSKLLWNAAIDRARHRSADPNTRSRD